jgi:hypothetical protein
MDKLEKTRQSEIRKMSDMRLQHKLIQAGFSIEIVEGMDRMAMLDKYAELVLAGKEPVLGTSAGTTATVVGYDVELERQRLEFQIKQWEAEKTEREARLELERAEREADRAAETEFRKAQLDWQLHQIKLLEERDKSEKNKEDAKVVQLKKYGDAFRNSVTKLGADPIEIIAFFDNIERQFKELNVPKELCVSLMRPYLNDCARTLINRVDASHSADYYYVKDFLLKEFRLVPQQLLEAFNTSTHQSHETFKAYITRLGMLLDYYLNSRNVTSIVELKELLVCDRVKTVLSESMVNRVLRSEISLPRTYASPNELADILDKYCANFDQNGRPRVSAIGLGVKRHTPNQGIAVAQHQSLPFYPSTSKSQTKNSQPALATATPVVAPGRRCFKCGSERHLYKDGDQRSSNLHGHSFIRNGTPKPSRVNPLQNV